MTRILYNHPAMKFDRDFYTSISRLALPIMAQSLISASMNLLDVVMLGQMGDTAVTAVGLANQLYFLLMFLLFGISSGAAVFTAQYWGRGDVPGIRRVLGICLTISLAGGVLFTGLALGFTRPVLHIYTNDPAVIELGARYLRWAGLGYLFFAVSYSYASVLRSTGQVRLPVTVSAAAILFKTGLSYLLIFGKAGLPALGVEGAAIATMIARMLECAALLIFTYRWKLPAAASLREMSDFDRHFLARYLKTALPVVFNESLWSLGITTYNAIYAHIGTESIAAVNIAGTVESLAFVIFIGISDACAILVGNKIGAGDMETAYTYARRSLTLAILGGMAVGGVILLTSGAILSLYKVSPDSLEYARRILIVQGLVLWIRVSNMTVIVGVLRSGGDTRFSLIVDAGTLWLIGVPTALLGAFVLHLPVYWVYLMVLSEEAVKLLVSLLRFRSRQWIHFLAA